MFFKKLKAIINFFSDESFILLFLMLSLTYLIFLLMALLKTGPAGDLVLIPFQLIRRLFLKN